MPEVCTAADETRAFAFGDDNVNARLDEVNQTTNIATCPRINEATSFSRSLVMVATSRFGVSARAVFSALLPDIIHSRFQRCL